MAPVSRFLLDRTSENLIDVFPGAVRLRDFSLADDADDERDIFPVATDYGLTIVTENDRHFIAAMRRASQRSGRVNCAGEGFGIVVPNHRTDIVFADLTRRLHYNGVHITWDDVRRYNLRVSVGERAIDVSALPRCKFCLADTADARARELQIL
jgi:hypothetical protein